MDKPIILIPEGDSKLREEISNSIIELETPNILEFTLGADFVNQFGTDEIVFAIIDLSKIGEEDLKAQLRIFGKRKIGVIFIENPQNECISINTNYQYFGIISRPFIKTDLKELFEKLWILKTIEKKDYNDWLAFKKKENYFFVKMNNQLEKIRFGDILWIQSEGNYSIIKTNDKKYALKSSLIKLQKKLPVQLFTRIHRSYIVQLDNVSKVDIASNLVFVEKEQLPIGRMYKSNVIQRLPIFE